MKIKYKGYITITSFESEGRAIKKAIPIDYMIAEKDGEIETLEGVFTFKEGDYILKGIQGELYACDKDIFEKSYDKVLDSKINKIEEE